MLAGLAAHALPSILYGLATGLFLELLDEWMVGRGDGLYLHKFGYCVKIDPVRGNGHYLAPHKNLPGVHGDRFIMEKDCYSDQIALSRTFQF